MIQYLKNILEFNPIRLLAFTALLAFPALWIFTSCQDANANPKDEAGTALIWADEFSKDGLPDETKWSYDIGDACDKAPGCGWGNAELQYYTGQNLKNARVENGHLIIEAHKQNKHNSKYTSARLVSREKGDWQYGKIEVRAKLPSGYGTWPAIWMLPTGWKHGGWPDSGEIDIMEHVGYARDSIYGTVHTKAYNHGIGTQKGGEIYLPSAEKNFHTYSIEWSEAKIDFFVDDLQYFSFVNERKSCEEWPFSEPFHLIMNLAVGGHWGGKHGVDEGIWPQRMVVDYVRVYSETSG